jgi:O-antigen ligase
MNVAAPEAHLPAADPGFVRKIRLAHVAGIAVALPILVSPVSQLAPEGPLAKLPLMLDAAVLAVLLAGWIVNRFEPSPLRPLLWLGLAILHALLSALWAIDQRICLTYGVRALHWSLWSFGLFIAIRDRADLLSVLRLLWGAGTVSAAVGIAQWLLPSLQVEFMKENTAGATGAALVWESELRSGSIVRVTGTMAHPLGLALLLNFTVAWTPALFRAAHPPGGRAAVLLGAVVQIAGLGLTYSRMAVLSLLLAGTVYILRGGVPRRTATLAAAAMLGALALPFLPATMYERLFDLGHFQKSESLTGRLEMQRYGSDLAMEHGLFGIGYGCYGPAYEATAKGMYVEQARWMLSSDEWSTYDLGDIGAHNTFLEVWVELGVIGLGLFFAVLGSLALGLARTNARLQRFSPGRDLGLCCEAGFASLLLTMLVLHIHEASIPWLYVGLAAAFLRVHRASAPEAA